MLSSHQVRSTQLLRGYATSSIPELPIGRYRLTATSPGFGNLNRDNIEVSVGAQLTDNFALPVGAVASTVEVPASSQSDVNSTSGEQSTLINPKQISDVPLNGRNSAADSACPQGSGSSRGIAELDRRALACFLYIGRATRWRRRSARWRELERYSKVSTDCSVQGELPMLYLRMCMDKPGANDMRVAHRIEHRMYAASFIEEGKQVRVVEGGPMCAGDTDDANLGSFMVVEAASVEDVWQFHEGDPFTKVGLFDRVDIIRWDRHIGGGSAYVPGTV